MTTVAAEIKALVSGARAAAGIVKRVDSSQALQARFDESTAEVHRDVGQVSYAVCKALVAHALGCDPSDDQVDEFMTAAVNEPGFPHRAFRLLGEAQKAASRHRRAFLAAMLFGLPFAKLPDDERDRVDMVVERIMPADVELLAQLSAKDRSEKRAEPDHPYFFKGTNLVALLQGIDVRIATSADHEDNGFGDDVYEQPRFCVDRAAFGSLLSLGCLDVGQSKASQGSWEIHTLTITPVGKLVARAIDEVRAGFAAGYGDGQERR